VSRRPVGRSPLQQWPIRVPVCYCTVTNIGCLYLTVRPVNRKPRRSGSGRAAPSIFIRRSCPVWPTDVFGRRTAHHRMWSEGPMRLQRDFFFFLAKFVLEEWRLEMFQHEASFTSQNVKKCSVDRDVLVVTPKIWMLTFYLILFQTVAYLYTNK
jgi:hypothetical protein